MHIHAFPLLCLRRVKAASPSPFPEPRPLTLQVRCVHAYHAMLQPAAVPHSPLLSGGSRLMQVWCEIVGGRGGRSEGS